MKKDYKICITFAGAVGSSKTPISNYISTKLSLPIFNNDVIRSEVIEDLGVFDANEHIKRRNLRLKEIVESGISFICDASVDREWKEYKKQLEFNGYKWFIISIDLGKDFLKKLYEAKGYFESLQRLDDLINDHNKFLHEFSDDINMHITENEFEKRLQVSYEKISAWIKALKD